MIVIGQLTKTILIHLVELTDLTQVIMPASKNLRWVTSLTLDNCNYISLDKENEFSPKSWLFAWKGLQRFLLWQMVVLEKRNLSDTQRSWQIGWIHLFLLFRSYQSLSFLSLSFRIINMTPLLGLKLNSMCRCSNHTYFQKSMSNKIGKCKLP